MKTIDHPNIIRIFEFFEDDRFIWIVSEICTGGDLSDYIKNVGKLEEEEACYLVHQVLSSLAHLHSKGISHRDIKPQNLLISKQFSSG